MVYVFNCQLKCFKKKENWMSFKKEETCSRCNGAGDYENKEVYERKCSECNGFGTVIGTYEPTSEKCLFCEGARKVKVLKEGVLRMKPPFRPTEEAVREYNEYYERNSIFRDCEHCRGTGKYHTLTSVKPKTEGCFLTTACVGHMELSDDCLELSVLRDYRDNFILSLPNGKELIKEYYHYSPVIVSKINESNDAEKIYQYIYIEIKTAVKQVQTRDFHQALETYKAMYKHLCCLFLVEL